MDWLEKYSPMRVDWKNKWMQIPSDNAMILLTGCPDFSCSELVFQLLSVQSADQQVSATAILPSDIQTILDQFPAVCAPPNELPPERPYDHCIPLIQGARPVNIRPYRYPPALKDEIES